MVLNKKGIFMTMSALLMGSLLIVFFSVMQEPGIDEEYRSLELRISFINDFINNMDVHIERRLIHVGRQALEATIDEMIIDGDYFTDYKQELEYCLMNIVPYCSENNLIQSLEDWDDFVSTGMGLSLNTTVSNLVFYQDNPWYISINATFNFVVSDLAKWNVTRDITAYVPITGLTDPLYAMNGEDSVIVSRYNLDFYTTGGNFTKQGFLERFSTMHLLLLEKEDVPERLYVAYPQAPKFLDRLDGETQFSEYGIVSLVDNSSGYSNMDFYHFNNECPSDTLVRIDFFNPPQMNIVNRGLLGVGEDDQERGLDNMIITYNFSTHINMSHPIYQVSESCP